MVFGVLTITACDFNPLGGSKSNLDPTFEPGKHQPSAPPTISALGNVTMDENDVQTIPFTIGDPDTVMACSMVFVKTASSNTALIDPTGFVVGGLFPNCTLRIQPKAFQFGVSNITLSVYDFWTQVDSPFQLTVIHILAPGIFSLVDARGENQAVDLTWTNAAYMNGSSGFYTVFYQKVAPLGPLQSISHVTSPYLVTGLDNGFEYDFYIVATNSIGSRQSNTLRAQPGKYQNRGGRFLAGATQYELTPGTANIAVPGTQYGVSASLLSEVDSTDTNYAALNYTAAEVPYNGSPAPGTPPQSAILTPSGKFKVYTGSQMSILAGTNK